LRETIALGSLEIDPDNPTYTIKGRDVAGMGATANKVGRTTGLDARHRQWNLREHRRHRLDHRAAVSDICD
jgi:hypothetical protein